MAKKKLARFAEMATFNHVFQPDIKWLLNNEFKLKDQWNKNFFRNNNPIVLELGCGKGEYTIGLAQAYPHKNFIGVDIKGARMWRGAKTALEKNLHNVAFVRTKIDVLAATFGAGEVSEIWITFPDPQPLKSRKRLSGAQFLNLYRKFLKENGLVHLKTDSRALYNYTMKVLELNQLPIHFKSNNLYQDLHDDPILSIKTFYEQGFLEQGKAITYLKFNIHSLKVIEDLPKDNQKYEREKARKRQS